MGKNGQKWTGKNQQGHKNCKKKLHKTRKNCFALKGEAWVTGLRIEDAGHIPGAAEPRQAAPGHDRLQHLPAPLLRHHLLPPTLLHHHHHQAVRRQPHR